MDWQPIETAPKDGTEILAWVEVKQKRMVMSFDRKWGAWISSPGRYSYQPTRWTPLPPAPTEGQ
jgi:hypothetical protein